MLIPFSKLLVNLIQGIINFGGHEADELDDYDAEGRSKILWVEANPEKASHLSGKAEDASRNAFGAICRSGINEQFFHSKHCLE